MTNTITKTAAVVFASAFALTGAAFAQDKGLDEKLAEQMKASQAQIAQTVNANAETRVSKLAAQKDQADDENSAQRFEVASK